MLVLILSIILPLINEDGTFPVRTSSPNDNVSLLGGIPPCAASPFHDLVSVHDRLKSAIPELSAVTLEGAVNERYHVMPSASVTDRDDEFNDRLTWLHPIAVSELSTTSTESATVPDRVFALGGLIDVGHA